MNCKLIAIVCLVGLFIATGLYGKTLDSMQRDLKKLESERAKVKDKLFAAQEELVKAGANQVKRSEDLKRAEEGLATARRIIGKLQKIRPDYSEELSRRQAELRKSFTGPDGWIPEDKRAVFQEAYNQLPKTYTRQMWEKDSADLYAARSLAALKEKDIAACRKDIAQSRSMEDPLVSRIAALKKDLDRVNAAIESGRKEIKEEEACLTERRSQQQESKREKDIEAKLKAADIAVNHAMIPAMALAIYKRLYGDLKTPAGRPDDGETAGKLAEVWKKTDNLKTLVEAIRKPAAAAGMGAQAGMEVVGITIQSLDALKGLYSVVNAMYNVKYGMGEARYGGALAMATSFDQAFDTIWRNTDVGRSVGRTFTEQRSREVVDGYVRDLAEGRRSQAGIASMMKANLAEAEQRLREADEMAKAVPPPSGQAGTGGPPAVAGIECYAIDQSDGSIGFWNSRYPNCSFDDEKGRRGKPNGQWKGSYSFKGDTLYLVVDNLRAQYPPMHTLGVGYTVTLRNATFEDGSTTKSFILYQYAGTPKDRRTVKSYPVVTGGSSRCTKK